MCIDGDCQHCGNYKCRMNKSFRAIIWRMKKRCSRMVAKIIG